MSQALVYQPISRQEHEKYCWRTTGAAEFAGRFLLVPVVSAELSKVIVSFPLVFAPNGNSFLPAALMGLRKGSNLYFDLNGNWRGGYMPAALRAYPFALIPGVSDQFTYCIDEAALRFAGNDPHGIGTADFEPIFGDGELTPRVQSMFELLTHVQKNRVPTAAACDALRDLGLIVPWDVTFTSVGGNMRIEGLYRVDEARLDEISDAEFLSLRKTGAYVVAISQLLSMQHLEELQRRDKHRQTEESVRSMLVENQGAEFNVFGGDTIKFS